MAIGNEELMHECFTNTSAWEQQDEIIKKKTEESGKKRGVSMEKSKATTKEKDAPTVYHCLIKI